MLSDAVNANKSSNNDSSVLATYCDVLFRLDSLTFRALAS